MRVPYHIGVMALALSALGLMAASWSAAQEGSASPTEQQCDARDQTACSCAALTLKGTNNFVTPCFPVSTQTPNIDTVDSLAVDAYSALNLPMDRSQGAGRGTPDIAAPRQGRSGAFLDYPPVWEGWRATSDIFRADGQAPVGWDATETIVPSACKGLTVTDELRKQYPWVPDSPLPPRVLDGFRNPQGEVLVDASGQPVRYEVLFNRQALDYVVANKLWSVAGLSAYIAENGQLSFPPGQFGTGERGAIIVKAAWKILDSTKKNDHPDRFHKSWAYVTPVVRNGQKVEDCAIVPVGLIGMHLMLKVDALTGWLWATFEHRALAPGWDEIHMLPDGDDKLDWLFWSAIKPCVIDGSCPDLAILNTPPVLLAQPGTPHPAFDPLPSRIIRLQAPGYYRKDLDCLAPGQKGAAQTGNGQTLVDQTDKVGFGCIQPDLELGFANSFVPHLVFKGAQWLDEDKSGTGISGRQVPFLTPEILANTAMESFNQADSNCYSCHRGAGSPAPGFPGFVPNPPTAVFDFIFAFQHIGGMPTSGNLP